jgi:hypothetical protein
MSKKSSTRPDTFEWTCTNCNYLNKEVLAPSEHPDNKIAKFRCKQCNKIRKIAIIDAPESAVTEDWLVEKCHLCSERKECFSKENKKIFKNRIHNILKLGFCEDYIVDPFQLSVDKCQVCREERTFDELFNKGIFPLDEA